MAGNESVFDVQIVGLDDVVARLKALPPELGRGGLRRALFAPAKMLREDVRDRVPVWKGNKYGANGQHVPGLLKDSIGVFRDRDPGAVGAAVRYFVGTRRLTKRYADTVRNRRYYRVGKKYKVAGAAFYAMFVEWGTQTTGLGRPGQEAKRPFGNAYEAHKNEVVPMFNRALGTEIEKAVNKLAKQKAGSL